VAQEPPLPDTIVNSSRFLGLDRTDQEMDSRSGIEASRNIDGLAGEK
jgi:hypothetical protein